MEKDSTLKIVILLGTIVSSIIALVVISSAAYIGITQRTGNLPKFIGDWGGLIIGFYFGSFVSLIKDWIMIQKKQSAEVSNNLSGT